MATKEAVFSLRVDTGNSVQDIQNADQAVKNFNKDLRETQATAASGTGVNKMQTDLQALNAKVEAGGLTMRQMTQAMKEYQNIAAISGASSPVGQEAIQNASRLKDEIGDLKGATTALSSDTVKLDTAMSALGTGAAVFQGIQGAAALAGIENEDLQKTMVKLTATQGILNAVSTVAKNLNKDAVLGIALRNTVTKLSNFISTGSTTTTAAAAAASAALAATQTGVAVSTGVATLAVKVFRLALVSTGIGAIVVLIGSLIAAFMMMGDEAEAASAKIDGMEKSLEKLGESQKFEADISDAIGERILLQAKLRGASSDELLKIEKKNMASSINMRLNHLKEIETTNFKIINNEFATAEQLGKAQAANQAAYQEGRLLLQRVETEKVNFALKEQENIKAQQEKNKQLADKNKEIAIKKKNDEIKLREDLLKNLNENIKYEIEIREQLEDLKIKFIKNDAERNIAALNETFGDFRQTLLEKAASKEIEILNQKFAKTKMTEIEYRAELEKINLAAIEKLSESEKLLLSQKEIELNNDILKIQIDSASERETMRKNRAKFLNEILLNETEFAIQKEIDLFNEQKKELDRLLLSTNEDEKISQQEHDKAMIELEKKKVKSIEDINKAAADSKKAAEIKAREEELAGVTAGIAQAEDALKKVKIVNDLLNEIATERINKINQERDEDLDNIDAQKQAELNVEGLTAEQKTGIEEKFSKQKYAVQLAAFNQEDKINRAKFNRDKAIKLAEVGINTASAIVKGIAEFGPPPSPAGIAAILTAGIIGTTQALAITNQKYQGGTMPTMPNITSGSGGGLAGTSASSFTSQPTTQTSTTGLIGDQLITSPVQVFVLENDISSTQNKVALQESKSSF